MSTLVFVDSFSVCLEYISCFLSVIKYLFVIGLLFQSLFKKCYQLIVLDEHHNASAILSPFDYFVHHCPDDLYVTLVRFRLNKTLMIKQYLSLACALHYR